VGKPYFFVFFDIFGGWETKQTNSCIEEKDITLTLATNPGPPKGCAPFWNCKGWYTTTKGTARKNKG